MECNERSMREVIRSRAGHRAVGAKGICCRVSEAIFGRNAINLYRGSDTIAFVIERKAWLFSDTPKIEYYNRT